MSFAKANRQYLLMIQKQPLMPITSDQENQRAIKVISELAQSYNLNKLSADERAYFDVLSRLVADYETQRFGAIQAKARELVAGLMEANGLSQVDMVPYFGTQSRVSEFLAGKRKLSKTQKQRLCRRFSLKPDILNS